MNKYNFTLALLLAVLSLTVAANGQTKIEAPPLGSSVAPLESNHVASASEKEISENSAARADVSGSETNFPNRIPRQQTYVRPSKDARLKRYVSEAFGVPSLIGATFGATVKQITNTPPEWEKNIGGFGKRFASGYGTNVIRQTISYGLSEAFKLDNKYERTGGKNIGKRIKQAFLGSYTTRTKTGKRFPDFPYVTGNYISNIIANEAWYPNRYSYKDGLRDGTISLAARFGVTLLREFLFPK